MRIAILTPSYPPMISGAAITAKHVAEGLVNRGHNILVLTASHTAKQNTIKNGRLTVVRFGSYNNPFRVEQRVTGWPLKQILNELNDFHPDLVHLFDPLAFAASAKIYCYGKNIPITLTVEQLPWFVNASLPDIGIIGSVIEQISWGYTRLLMNQCAEVVAPTNTISEIIHAETGIHSQTISNGVELSVFGGQNFNYEDFEIRRWLGIPQRSPVILSVGRLDMDKKVDLVVQASARAMHGNQAHLVIVGDGTQKNNLIKLCSDLGIAERSHFTGFIRDSEKLAKLYRFARVFVNASEIETQGITLLEANACGTPIVAVSATCIPEFVHHGVNGLLVEPGDIQDFSKAILKMINHPEEAHRMGLAGREEVRKHSIEQTIYDYEKMTAGILAGESSLAA